MCAPHTCWTQWALCGANPHPTEWGPLPGDQPANRTTALSPEGFADTVVLEMGIQGASLLGFSVWPPFLLSPQVVTRLIHLLGEKILGSLQQGTATGVSWGAPPSWP